MAIVLFIPPQGPPERPDAQEGHPSRSERHQVKYKGTIIAEGSGSIGGLTASHNRGGQYMRQRAVPVNPNTSFQQLVRSWFANANAAWSGTLTQAQRDAWDTYALQTPIADALGNQINAGGKGMFIRGYVPRLQAGLSLVAAGPSTYGLPVITAPGVTSITATTRVAIITFANTDGWATAVGGALLMFSSRPQSTTINGFKGPYRFAGKVLGAVSPPTSPQNITTPFPLVAGQRVFVRFVAVTADGRLSPDVRFSIAAV